jgi:hypothetical protein
MRIAMMDSSPMLESDFFRYLWDGAVVANGMNPYRHAPREGTERSEAVPEEIVRLAKNSQDVIHRINHPQLRTIYPPAAQLAFATAYVIKPWSLLALRIVLGAFDAATAVLLYITLKNLRLPRDWLAVYWWNPLVILEVFNAAHVDVLTLPFAVGACLAAHRGRHVWASVLLGLGAGMKLWPVVLLPLLLASLWKSPRLLAKCVGIFGFICGLLFIPVYLGGFDGTSGFVAYGRQWEMNDALYMLLWWVAEGAVRVLSLPQTEIHLVARMLATVILGCLVLYLCRNLRDRYQMWESSLLAITALFMVSPTQFPWYYLWVVPFLAVRPRFSLLLLGTLLPLYYLRFYFKARGSTEIFDNYIVWLEYLPAWIVFLMEQIAPGRFRKLGNCRGVTLPERHPTASL